MKVNLMDVLQKWRVSNPLDDEYWDKILGKQVFAGLQDRNTGFDATCIVHFSPTDFVTVMDRCERLAINMFGMEVFDGKHALRAVHIRPELSKGLVWARHILTLYLPHPEYTIAATYDVRQTRLRDH
jgi:hypothetical protein